MPVEHFNEKADNVNMLNDKGAQMDYFHGFLISLPLSLFLWAVIVYAVWVLW